MTNKNIIFDLMGVLLVKTLDTTTGQFNYHPVNFNEIVKLLRACRDAGNRLFILSNLSVENYNRIRDDEHISSLFSFFDGLIISGMTPYKKPDPRIFSIFCNTYHVAPESAVFIDDKQDNCLSAQSVGITRTINCEEFNLVQIAQELTNFGALPTESE